jgi:hypothetical protein
MNGEVEKTVRVTAGGSAAVKLTMPTRGVEPDLFAPPKGPNLIPAIVLGGVALVAGAIGIGLFVAGGEKGSEATDQLAALRAEHGPVPCPSASGCAALMDLRLERDKNMNVGTGVLIGSSAALAGAIGYTVWALGPSSSRRKHRISFVPVISPAGGGAWLQGAF